MKKIYSILTMVAGVGLLASSTQAAEVKVTSIEVCTIDLAAIVDANLVAPGVIGAIKGLGLQHVYVRGIKDNGSIEAFDFKPKNGNFMGDEAKIADMDYAGAFCVSLPVDDAKKDDTLDMFRKEYTNAAEMYRYSINGKHCQSVTEEIMTALEFEMPDAIAQRLEQQNKAQRVLSGKGSAEDTAQVLVGAAVGFMNNNPGCQQQ